MPRISKLDQALRKKEEAHRILKYINGGISVEIDDSVVWIKNMTVSEGIQICSMPLENWRLINKWFNLLLEEADAKN